MGWWHFGNRRKASESPNNFAPEALSALDAQLQQFNQDPYLYWYGSPLRLLSVFDELTYDRADLDILSLRMRQHVVAALTGIDCVQQSGHLIVHPATGVRFVMPKFVALGASPFAVTRYHQRQEHDYWIFTPTQAACFLIDNLPFADALSQIEALVQRQPVNLYRILDFIEHKASHQLYCQAVGHLSELQQQAVSSEPLNRRRAL